MFIECSAQKLDKSLVFEGPVSMHGRCIFPDKRRRDHFNYHELIADALEGVAYRNDFQVKQVVWEVYGFDKQNPRIEVEIQPLIGDGPPWQ
jgi:Holliday junction resolvase RusA-like endonuclease